MPKYSLIKDKYGFIKRDRDEMQSVFLSYPELKKVFLFGSRSMGTHRNGSDIDIALLCESQKITKRIHSQLEEETNIPYFIDVINLQKISSQPLKEHIERNGVVIYEKGSENTLPGI